MGLLIIVVFAASKRFLRRRDGLVAAVRFGTATDKGPREGLLSGKKCEAANTGTRSTLRRLCWILKVRGAAESAVASA